MQLSAPIFLLKRRARHLARESSIPLHQALDQIAIQEGFKNWGHLSAKSRDGTDPIGELVLVAARPGQGKTLLALELLAQAVSEGAVGYVFSLEDTVAKIRERYARVGGQAAITVDVSDEISAGYVARRLSGTRAGTVAVIDYLQLLDQRRSTPPLADQVANLRAFSDRSGVTLICISQVDRHFDPSAKVTPDLADLRLPNPVDLTLFDRALLLHKGELREVRPAVDIK